MMMNIIINNYKTRSVPSNSKSPLSKNSHRIFSNFYSGTATSGKPNILIRALIRYYSPFAMRVTSFVFGVGGVFLAEELQQKDKNDDSNINWSKRLGIDAIGALVYGFVGFYLHMLLPFILVFYPLLIFIPQDSDSVDNDDDDDDDDDDDETKI